MKTLLIRPAPILLLALLCGCSLLGRPQADPVRFPYLRDPAIDGVRRLVFAPCYRGVDCGDAAAVLDTSLSAAWRELGTWEVVVIRRAERDELFGTEALTSNRIEPAGLRRLRDRYRAEAALFFQVDAFDSYDPVAIGLRGYLVSTADGAVLWSGGGHFDGRREDIQADLASWYGWTVGSGHERLGGWRTALSSPSLFARYVADRLAASTLVALDGPAAPGGG